VNRLQLDGRDKIVPYFTRYAEVTKWRFALGAVEGRPAMLVFDSTGPMESPAHFDLIDWAENRITRIRDFLFAPHVLEAIDWVRLGQESDEGGHGSPEGGVKTDRCCSRYRKWRGCRSSKLRRIPRGFVQTSLSARYAKRPTRGRASIGVG